LQVCHDALTDNGEHGDAAVLELDPPEVFKLLLVLAGGHAEGIKESERSLSAELILVRSLDGVDSEGGRGTDALGGSKGCGGAGNKGADGELVHIAL